MGKALGSTLSTTKEINKIAMAGALKWRGGLFFCLFSDSGGNSKLRTRYKNSSGRNKKRMV
jgi:hypothetical protein